MKLDVRMLEKESPKIIGNSFYDAVFEAAKILFGECRVKLDTDKRKIYINSVYFYLTLTYSFNEPKIYFDINIPPIEPDNFKTDKIYMEKLLRFEFNHSFRFFTLNACITLFEKIKDLEKFIKRNEL